MNKKCKEEVATVGLPNYEGYKRIPFTSPRMNYCTFGGLPVGKVIEFYGEEHGGKTTTTLDIIANYQNMDERKVLYVDAENTLDADWATKLGVNVDDLIILHPTSQGAEDIFQFICDSVETGEIGLWVIDSLGVLLSQDEIDKDMDEATYAGISKSLTRFSKKVEMLNAKHKCTGIGINQLRDDLKSTWGGTKTTGGKCWKHVCSVRMEFSKGKYIDESGKILNNSTESPYGNEVMMLMKKNKTCPPTRRTGQYTLTYEYGIDYLTDLIDVAIRYDIVKQSGAWFSIVDTETGEIIKDKIHGQSNVNKLLDEDEELLKLVEAQVDSQIGM